MPLTTPSSHLPQPHLAEGFAACLAPFDLAVMEQMPATICGLWPDLSLGYVNRAWNAFGRANGGSEEEGRWGLGANVLDVVPLPLRPFYERLFARALETRAPVDHDYECSSPARRRTFRMRAHPTVAGAVVVVHSLLCEAAHGEEAHAAIERAYRSKSGMIEQCAHCRRVRRAVTPAGTAAEWDWVPGYVAHMPARTSHGVCAICMDYFYSEPEVQ
jgi:hypothetical protein